MDSQFEWVAHEPEALKEGVPQNTIDVIKYRRSTEGLDETDALIIELGRQLWRDHKVKSETFAKLKAIFGPNKLVELVMLMGNYAGTAALLSAVDMQLHAGKNRCCIVPADPLAEYVTMPHVGFVHVALGFAAATMPLAWLSANAALHNSEQSV